MQTLPEFAGDKERWRWGWEATVTYKGMASGRGVNQAQDKAPGAIGDGLHRQRALAGCHRAHGKQFATATPATLAHWAW